MEYELQEQVNHKNISFIMSKMMSVYNFIAI